MKAIAFALGLSLACRLVASASNEPRPIVWSPLLDLAEHTELEWVYHDEDGRARIVLPDREARLFSGLRRLEIDDALYWMNGPLLYLEDDWRVSETDMNQTLIPLLAPEQRRPPRKPFIVVIDPGHGGHDPGAVVDEEIFEKDIVLDVARRLRRKLIQNGITVRMTRDQDVFVTLEERPRLAEKWKASIFISIHANKAHNGFAHGIESFILPAPGFPGTSETNFPQEVALPGNRFDGENLLLADALHRPLIKKTGAFDRGIKRERFIVLRDAPCPAVLLELGFLSNTADRKKLLDSGHRTKLAQAILEGILAYRGTEEEHQDP